MLNISKKNPIAENIEHFSTVKNLANRPHYQILNKIIIYIKKYKYKLFLSKI